MVFGHADDVDAELVELRRHPEGVLAADGDERVDTGGVQVLPDPLHAVVDLERVGARRAEDGAAAGQDAAHLGDAQRHRHAAERAGPTVAEADELVAVDTDSLADDGADHSVQSRAVAATGQYPNAHVHSPSLRVVRYMRRAKRAGQDPPGESLVVPYTPPWASWMDGVDARACSMVCHRSRL